MNKKNNSGVPAGANSPVAGQIIQILNARIEKHLDSSYDFRYNLVTGTIQYKKRSGYDYLPISDYVFNSLSREMILIGIPCSVSILRTILISDYTPLYNPFESYFGALQPWDGHTDHILELAQTVTTTDDPLWHICFRKWLVALVGCVLEDDVINHTVIVFAGQQGLGKTTWILNLLPAELKAYCFSGTINPNNKDTLVHLSETALINMDELENLNRSELGALKELITKTGIRLRRPYGFTTETMPRRASFAGSVNGKEFLSDPTGNRRFLCFEVTGIKYVHTVSLAAVYAQALYLFRAGFQHWFDPTEIATMNKNNEQYRCLAVEEELLIAHFEPCISADADYFLSTTELLTWLTQKAKIGLTESSKNKMGKALRACGFLRLKKHDRYVYALKEKFLVPNLPTTTLLSTKHLVEGLFG